MASRPTCKGEQLGEKWFHDGALLQHEYAAHGTLEAIEAAHGPTVKTLRVWWGRNGLPSLPRGPQRSAPVLEEPSDEDSAVLAAMKKLKDKANLQEVADEVDCSPKRVKEAIDRLQNAGYRIDLVDDGDVVIERSIPQGNEGQLFEVQPELLEGDVWRFGVVSDTHMGSKEARVDLLETAYHVFEQEGVTSVYHPGDLVAGKGIYRHQINDLMLHTYDDQVRFAANMYPRKAGITTYIIGGNHDLEGDFGKEGADPVLGVCNQREDMVYCGRYSAWFDLPNGARMHMLHPMGGGSYAISYKAQKIAEAYEGGEKPNLTLFGHWHRRAHFEARGIELLLCGTLEGSTDLARRVGLGPPALGFHIVDAVLADDGSLVDLTARWLKFYPGRKVFRVGGRRSQKG